MGVLMMMPAMIFRRRIVLSNYVLGEQFIALQAEDNLDNCTKQHVNYGWVTAPINAPQNNCTMFNAFFRSAGANAQVCLYTSATNPKTWIRYQDGANNWGSWKEYSYDIPLFYKDYNSLESLISAVGGFLYESYNGDMNNLGGIKFGHLGENATNIPSGIAYSEGNVYVCIRSSTLIGVQLIFSNLKLYYRRYIFGVWKEWTTIQ